MNDEIDFRGVALAWCEHKRCFVKRSTMCNYQLSLQNHLVPAFGNMRDISEETVQRFVIGKLRSGLSRKSVHDMLVLLRMVMRFGAKHFGLRSPDWEIRFPSCHSPKALPVLSIRHHRKLLAFLNDNLNYRNLGILICMHTGMRIGEICALTWGDIDVRRGMISVSKTIGRLYVVDNGERHTEIAVTSPKTSNSRREIPMSQSLLRIVRPLRAKAYASYYVVTNKEKPTEPRTYRAYFRRLLDRIGIPRVKFHGLRHSFATRCIEGKADYKTVSVILGHSRISTTLDLYVHPGNDQKKRCIDRMMKHLLR